MLARLDRTRVLAERAVAQARQSAIIRRVRQERLTYLSPLRLTNLERYAHRAPPGHFVEAGVALGGSAVVLLFAMRGDRQFHAYDLFGQIPPPGEHDPEKAQERYAVIAAGRSTGIAGDTYYGYLPDLAERVGATLARYGHPIGDRVHLHQGLYEDTFHPPSPVAFAHIDCDWYDSVRLCLERLWDALAPGAFIVIDDYHDWGGCRLAVDEFRADHQLEVATARDHLVLRRPI